LVETYFKEIIKEFATSEILTKIEDEFVRQARFQNKTLEMINPKLIRIL